MSKLVKGVVTSTKMDRTIVVRKYTLKKIKPYVKYVKHSTRYYVHDEKQQAQVGQTVIIRETRPLSKLKRWNLEQVRP